MRGRLENKVWMITGATGIAAATAELAAQQGARVFIVSLKPEDCLALSEKIRATGGDCAFLAGDLVSATTAAQAIQQCVAKYQQLDGLFNVAGISGRRFGDGPVHECSETGWDATLNNNLKSVFLMCRAALLQMLKQPVAPKGLRGAIINTTSVVAFSPSPKHFATHAYAASKGAIISLTQSMAGYYAPHKIRVNALAPSLVRTPMSLRAQQTPTIVEYAKTKQALVEGMLEPDAIARAALFLMSDDANAITGDVLTVDGGWCTSRVDT